MWRAEPFRIFFPLGVVLAWIGIGHWVVYAAGWIETYSCEAHGLVQVQGFLLAFALGFLLTAIPRRTASAPASGFTIVAIAGTLVGTTAAAFVGHWGLAEGGTIAVLLALVAFAVRRFRTGERRPPAAFLLLPIGLACAVAGAVFITADLSPRTAMLGRLLVTQGCFFCLVMGAGALVLPLMSGNPPPPDLGSGPRVARAAIGYLVAGLAVVATLVAEAFGSGRVAPVTRGLVVAATLAYGAGTLAPLAQSGTNRRVARLATWLVPVGPLVAGLLPDYRVPALHLTFIGGFALLAIAVATHVTASHCGGLATIRDGRSTVVRLVAAGIVLVASGRFVADATETYFEHLAFAAALWILVTAFWVLRLVPAWIRRPSGGGPGAKA